MNASQRERVLASCQLFSSLEAGAVAALARDSTATFVPPGRVVLRKGQVSRWLHIIAEGSVKLYLASAAGKEYCVAVAGRSMPVDISVLVDGRGSLLHAVAAEPTTLLSLNRASIESVRAAEHQTELILDSLSTQIHQLTAALEDVALHNLEARVARILHRLHADSGRNPAARVHRLDQTTIASMANGTRSKVNVALQKLRRLGAIEIDGGRVVIRSADLLLGCALPSIPKRVSSRGHSIR